MPGGASARHLVLATMLAVSAACTTKPVAEAPAPSPASADEQHAGITTPHGDHTPHHGGLVMMGGDLHYEVVFDPAGRHHVWFSDAVREDLPASTARDVMMVITRPSEPPEALTFAIDDSGESWVTSGKPVAGDDVMAKVTFAVRGEPFEVEIPYLAPQ